MRSTIAAFVLLFGGILYLVSPPFVCSGASCVTVELARTHAELELGLMYRKGLDGGMLFVFPAGGDYGFWMRNMEFPIDIVWISGGREVVGVSADVPPCSCPAQPCSCPTYFPPSPVRYVLEVPANYSAVHGFVPGRSVVFFGVGGS